MKLRILIIDDDWETRKDIYKNVLSDSFIIEAVETAPELFIKLHECNVDGYLVDIVLENWKDEKGKPQELIPILENINHKMAPVFLLSGQFDNLVNKDDNRLTRTINEIIEKSFLVKSFFVWSDFEKESRYKDDITRTNTIKSSIYVQLLSHSKMSQIKQERIADIGIVCALSSELAPFLDKTKENFNPLKDENLPFINTTFKRGIIKTINGKEIKFVAVTQPRMGMVDCSYLSSILITEFKVKNLFMIGVCGGRESENYKEIEFGSVIIPKTAIAYQHGKINENGFELNPTHQDENSNIEGAIGSDDDCNRVFLEQIVSKYRENNRYEADKYCFIPQLKFDEIACGEVIINKRDELDQIAKEVRKPKLCAVDMESYALYRASKFFPNVKVTLIKSVMDKTNGKSDKYKTFASYISSEYLYNLLYYEKIQI
jgi:nucleoside phosphorylase